MPKPVRFNKPTRMELTALGAHLLITQKHGAEYPARNLLVELKKVTASTFGRLMTLFEGDYWTDCQGDCHEYRLLGRISPITSVHLNPNGVEVDDRYNIPLCCWNCPFFEDLEYDYDDQVWAKPYCRKNVWWPTQKGNCAKKLSYFQFPLKEIAR